MNPLSSGKIFLLTLSLLIFGGTWNVVRPDDVPMAPVPKPPHFKKIHHAVLEAVPQSSGEILFEKARRISSKSRFLNAAAFFKGGLWLVGSPYRDDSKSEVWFSADGSHWNIKPTPPFGPRTGQGLAVLDGRLWMIGGLSGLAPQNDVWSSSDGEKWTRVTASAKFSSRMGHALVAFGGKLWVIGGENSEGRQLNDVWSSKDGVHWSQSQKNERFSPRSFAGCATAQGKIWIICGWDGSRFPNDVWSSKDGVHWKMIEDSPPFGGRSGALLLGEERGLWLMGGRSTSTWGDIWFSKSGKEWEALKTQTPFQDLYGFTGTLEERAGGLPRLWVMGGIPWEEPKSKIPSGANPQVFQPCGIWASEDAVNWEEKTQSSGFDTKNSSPLILNYDGKLWVVTPWGGVWNSSDGQDWNQVRTGGDQQLQPLQGGVLGKRMWISASLNSSVHQVPSGGLTMLYYDTFRGIQFSGDGKNWVPSIEPTPSSEPPLSDREGFVSATFQGKIWILGGSGGVSQEDKNDVWSSLDGKTWTCVQPHAQFPPRSNIHTAVFGGKLWVIGGTTHDGRFYLDVWNSENGVDWERPGSFLRFIPQEKNLVVFGERLWLYTVGGYTGKENEVWSTVDGADWKKYSVSKPFGPGGDLYFNSGGIPSFRYGLADFHGKMWLIGRNSQDVWLATPPP